MTQRGGPQFIPRPEGWWPGRPAPWADLEDPLEGVDLHTIRASFPPARKGRPSPVAAKGASPSAVLLAVFDDPDAGGLHMVLTRRSWGLRTHRGEISLPGGRVDPGESIVEAALREASEEVDLDSSEVTVLGELDHLTTVTRRAYIVPVVAVLPSRPEMTANPDEVDAILTPPLTELFLPEVFREERWGDQDLNRPIYYFDLIGDTVWGATAAIMRQFLSLLVGADPGSPTDLDPARDTPPGFRLSEDEASRVV